jgi:thymidylate kinase
VKRYTWNDPVMGELTAGPEALDDFILMKADGLPTYNFAHIVDDAEMGVTHVIRGLEYISSIPRYLSLYEALELPVPVLACLPHVMAPDGKKKLGKRDGAKSVTDYRTDGILPETMLNFLASLGWNDGTEQEIFTREELIAKGTDYPSLAIAEAYALDRMILYKKFFIPALAAGKTIISDRSVSTSLVYQTISDPTITYEIIRTLPGNAVALSCPPTDLILFQIDPEVGLARLASRFDKNDNAIFEEADFQKKAYAKFMGSEFQAIFKDLGTDIHYLAADAEPAIIQAKSMDLLKKILSSQL